MQTRKITAAGIIACALFAGASANAQDAKPGAKPAGDVAVAVTQPKDALRNLRSAVRELREASVLLLNQKEQSAARDKAVSAAQDAIMLAQRAMAQLPAEMRISDAKVRDAKDWPAAASRLDKASLALERAIDNLEKGDGKDRSGAVDAVQKAMDEVENALLAMPDWKPGSK